MVTDGTMEARRPLICPLTYSRKGGCTLTWTRGSAGQTVIRGIVGLGETQATVRTEKQQKQGVAMGVGGWKEGREVTKAKEVPEA